MKNSLPDFVLYNDYLINEFYDILKKKQTSTLINMGIYEFSELFILIIMIILEWIFIYLGYKKLKNKTNFFKDQFIKTFGYILSDSQNKLLEDELYNHMDKLWFNEIYEPDRKFIMNLVKKIAIEGRV